MPEPRDAASAPHGPVDRADAFARYVALLEHQLAALDADDLSAFHRLADQRDALAARLDADRGRATTTDPEHLELLLRRAVELDARVRERLSLLRERITAEMRALDRQKAMAASYLRGPTAGRRIDRRY
ncbi:MAG: flagellar protein FliT [Gemmatimonadetes bacterium]|nr:flagellar protein FliT [Gemmatimonadota bacterium]